jgi:hypothetical protein
MLITAREETGAPFFGPWDGRKAKPQTKFSLTVASTGVTAYLPTSKRYLPVRTPVSRVALAMHILY